VHGGRQLPVGSRAHSRRTPEARHPRGDLNATSLQIDDEEHEVTNKPADRQHLNAEEVGRGDRAPMSPQERAPRQCLAPARGLPSTRDHSGGRREDPPSRR
jgi:hypothetical protein